MKRLVAHARHSRPVLVAVLYGIALAAAAPVRPTGASPPDPSFVVADRANGSPIGTPLVLRGTIVTPDGVLKHGYVGIVGGRIVSVSDKQPDIPDAVTVNTEGIIVPGFVDLHNRVPWNVLPRWTPGRTFTNQPQWNDDPEFALVRARLDHLVSSHFCDMNAWGELRALVGGTTSVMATYPFPCVHGLVRNLDWNSGSSTVRRSSIASTSSTWPGISFHRPPTSPGGPRS